MFFAVLPFVLLSNAVLPSLARVVFGPRRAAEDGLGVHVPLAEGRRPPCARRTQRLREHLRPVRGRVAGPAAVSRLRLHQPAHERRVASRRRRRLSDRAGELRRARARVPRLCRRGERLAERTAPARLGGARRAGHGSRVDATADPDEDGTTTAVADQQEQSATGAGGGGGRIAACVWGGGGGGQLGGPTRGR